MTADETPTEPRTITYMDLREFMDLGYLQEINRQFLHPLGMALSLDVADDGKVTFAGIWDDRWDPEGVRFDLRSFENPTQAQSRFKSNVATVEREWETRRAARESALGYMVQPANDPALGG